jgi:hypothetical protein
VVAVAEVRLELVETQLPLVPPAQMVVCLQVNIMVKAVTLTQLELRVLAT